MSATSVDDDLVELARDLVRLESENPPGNERACAEYVHEWFEGHGIDAELVGDPDPERPQIAARVGAAGTGEDGEREADRATVVLNGHLDVVPADDPEAWDHPPYAAEVEDGRLYGRGSVDMKTQVAIAMLVARDIAEEIESDAPDAFDAPDASDASDALSGSLVVHAAMGEETADPGTRTLLERGYDGDFGVVLEPTDFRVATSTKGLAVYRLTVRGEASHASTPDLGVNPIEAARPVLDAIEAYDADLRQRSDPLCGRAYATVTEFAAGVGSNLGVIPPTACLILDRRVLPGEELDAVDGEVADVVGTADEAGQAAVEWERIQYYAASEISADDPLAELFRGLSADAVGAPTEPWGMQAATDMRNLVNDAGMTAITWGPGSLDQAHTVDEYVDLADAQTGYDLLSDACRDLLG